MQTCHLEIGSFAYTARDVVYKWQDQPFEIDPSVCVGIVLNMIVEKDQKIMTKISAISLPLGAIGPVQLRGVQL